MEARDLLLVKLGGSLLTDKRRPGHLRTAVLERLAAEVAGALGDLRGALLIGHGSGSFGHVAAARHGLRAGLGDAPPIGAADTQNEAARLHRSVCGALIEAGAPAWTWAPSTALTLEAGRPVTGDLRPLLGALSAGMVPVTYGDVVVDRELGAAIASTEAVLGYLIRRLRRRSTGPRVRRVLWLGETAGIYDRDGLTVPTVDEGNRRRIRGMIGEAAGTDVTGGMLLRLDTTYALARLGIESLIADGTVPGLAAAALRGEDVPGTRVLPR
ncbi:MAG: isopentenyl phosphate kinase [Acidobacteriota bacterium]